MVSPINTHIKTLQNLYKEHFNTVATHIEAIPQSGSDRQYFILSDGTQKAVGAYNPDLTENRTFFYFTELFQKYNLPVPQLYHKGNNKGYYLIEYLEGQSLLSILQEEGYSKRVKKLFTKSIDYLIRFQWDVAEEIDYDMCHAAKEFDKGQILSDLMYFKYYFLDLQKLNYDKVALMAELEEWAREMSAVLPKSFMYRDFQSRNILVNDKDKISFIDYQGGMEGLPHYDLVSLLWQARASLPANWKKELFNYYLTAIGSRSQLVHLNEITFGKTYLDCVLLRILQTLGAYGFRGLIEHKEHFLKSIVPALNQLKGFLDEHPRHPSFPELRKVLEEITKENIINKFMFPVSSTHLNSGLLKVDIYSFSFKKGTARDIYGNGGGFVFDCRGILNPGRQEAYKNLTGMDKEVQEYLERETLMPEYLTNVFKVIDYNIQDYLDRGFEHLSISFGCTGGQHRSVYAAEKTAQYLKDRYGLQYVAVHHLEQSEHDVERAFAGKLPNKKNGLPT